MKTLLVILINIKRRIWWLCDICLELRLVSYNTWLIEEICSDIGNHYRNERK